MGKSELGHLIGTGENDTPQPAMLRQLPETVKLLKARVGDVRGGDRAQMAHRSGVGYYALRKFQTPGLLNGAGKPTDLKVLHKLITYFYPDKIMAPDGGLQPRTPEAEEYWRAYRPPAPTGDVTYI